MKSPHVLDPSLDLSFQRVVDVPRSKVWRAWTEPELLKPWFMFTAMIELADHAGGTQYTATVIHADEAGCKKHAAMGFEAGWGAALDQMVAMLKRAG